MLGDGFAVIPNEGTIIAPVDGRILTIMDTKHAITMESATGPLELVLHFGIDTVELKGAPFSIEVASGQHVKRGDIIAKVDLAALKAAGKPTDVMTIITNMEDVAQITPLAAGQVEINQDAVTVKTK